MPSRPKRRNGEDHEEGRMRSSKSWGPAVSTLSSGVSLLLGVAQTAMLLRLEGSDRVLEAQTLHMVTALESTLSELVEIRRDMASWRARAPPVVAVQEQAAADIDIEIEDASYPEPDHEPFWPSAAEEIPEPALRFEAESWDPNCFDVRTTGLSLECKDLGPHCGKGSSAPAIRAMCPRACNMTCDDFCRDLEFTTFQEPDGSMSSCRHLRLNCQDWESGERVRRICPVTCGICPGAPLSPPGLEEEAIFRLLTNGTKALERALRSTGAKPPRYLHRIPPILHQTWKTDLIPAKYGADISSWLRLHPTWRYEFWDDARGAALVLDEIPEYAAAFKQMSGIKRADVVRIVALHERSLLAQVFSSYFRAMGCAGSHADAPTITAKASASSARRAEQPCGHSLFSGSYLQAKAQLEHVEVFQEATSSWELRPRQQVPAGVMLPPDRVLHELHVQKLDSFLSSVDKDPSGLQKVVGRRREKSESLAKQKHDRELTAEKTITFFTAVNLTRRIIVISLSAFQQVTTKVPPSYDGRSSWFAYEDAIDDWCDITELDAEKRGPALRNRLEGEAAIHKRLLDRDRLKDPTNGDPTNGVKYFKSFLRPLFVKGAANVFLYRFQQFMNMHRGNGDMLRHLDGSEGYWVEDEDDGAEGFLEADEDTFWIYDEENYSWFQRRFQGRRMKPPKFPAAFPFPFPPFGSSGKRFFKRKKGRSNLADDNPDHAWQTTDGQWQDSQWQDQYWDDWSWYESEESYAAKGKGKA
eukprot:s4425_g1.t1